MFDRTDWILMYQCGMSPPKMSDELRSKRLNTTVTVKKMKAFTSKDLGKRTTGRTLAASRFENKRVLTPPHRYSVQGVSWRWQPLWCWRTCPPSLEGLDGRRSRRWYLLENLFSLAAHLSVNSINYSPHTVGRSASWSCRMPLLLSRV